MRLRVPRKNIKRKLLFNRHDDDVDFTIKYRKKKKIFACQRTDAYLRTCVRCKPPPPPVECRINILRSSSAFFLRFYVVRKKTNKVKLKWGNYDAVADTDAGTFAHMSTLS